MAPHVRLARMSLSTRSLGGALLLVAAAGAVQAQRREVAADNPQARLMGFYAAVMQFTPTGLPAAGSGRRGGGGPRPPPPPAAAARRPTGGAPGGPRSAASCRSREGGAAASSRI